MSRLLFIIGGARRGRNSAAAAAAAAVAAAVLSERRHLLNPRPLPSQACAASQLEVARERQLVCIYERTPSTAAEPASNGRRGDRGALLSLLGPLRLGKRLLKGPRGPQRPPQAQQGAPDDSVAQEMKTRWRGEAACSF